MSAKAVKTPMTKEDEKKLYTALFISFAIIVVITLFTVDLGRKVAEPPEMTAEERMAMYESLRNVSAKISPSVRQGMEKLLGMRGVREIRFSYEGGDEMTVWLRKRGGAEPLLFRSGMAYIGSEGFSFYMMKEEGGDELHLLKHSTGEELIVPL